MQLTSLKWDVDLLRQFNVPAPRYTSYPPANQFSEVFVEADYRQFIASQDTSIAPLSIYLHVPFCRQNCFYCACNKIITRDAAKVERYMEAVLKEIAMLGALHGRRRVVQLHWGGGTPTYLSRGQITQIMYALGQCFEIDPSLQHDYSIEIDPRTVNAEDIALLRGLGFNRISMGIQDFDPTVQRLINRVQSLDQVEELTAAVRENEFESLNFDLIYGLPGQTKERFQKTLAAVIRLSPDRIACYNYAHLPDKFPGQRGIDEIDLPSADQKLALLSMAGEVLQAAGYCYLGMDHFAKQTDSLVKAFEQERLQRNFQGYSTVMAEDIVAIGPSAISSIGTMYAQNAPSLSDYCAALDVDQLPIYRGHLLSRDDMLRREVIMRLACELSLSFARFERCYRESFTEYFAAELSQLHEFEEQGLLTISDARIEISAQGRHVIRNILLVFDAYHQALESRRIFSKAI